MSADLTGRLAQMRTLLPLLSCRSLLFQNECLCKTFHMRMTWFFMRMSVQVTYTFIPNVSHKDSFCHRGKSKLGIALFIPGAIPRARLLCNAVHKQLSTNPSLGCLGCFSFSYGRKQFGKRRFWKTMASRKSCDFTDRVFFNTFIAVRTETIWCVLDETVTSISGVV